jgi:hypothetical protein
MDFSSGGTKGSFGEGYWCDHWTYILDLIEEYLTVYPDREKELLTEEKYTYYAPEVRVNPYRERYVEKSGYPSNDFGYQARLFGFIAERLTTAFFFKYMHDNGSDSVEEIDVVVTEETYNKLKVKHLDDLKK